MSIFRALAVTSLALAGCAAPARVQAAEPRPSAGFSAISTEGSATVVVTVGKPHGTTVTCSDGDARHMETRLDGQTLVVSGPHTSLNESVTCNVEIALPSITALESRGSGTVTLRGRALGLTRLVVRGSVAMNAEAVEAERVELSLTGSGVLRLNSLTSKRTFIEMGGSGNVHVGGRTDSVEAKTVGSAELDGKALEATDCRLKMRGSARANLFASHRADVDAAGSGDAVIFGHPSEKTQNVQGTASVRFD